MKVLAFVFHKHSNFQTFKLSKTFKLSNFNLFITTEFYDPPATTTSASGMEWLTAICVLLTPASGKKLLDPTRAKHIPEVLFRILRSDAKSAFGDPLDHHPKGTYGDKSLSKSKIYKRTPNPQGIQKEPNGHKSLSRSTIYKRTQNPKGT